MEEKKNQKHQELLKNKEYVAQVLAKDENDRAADKEHEKKLKDLKKEV
jgi:hypothetical protein